MGKTQSKSTTKASTEYMCELLIYGFIKSFHQKSIESIPFSVIELCRNYYFQIGSKNLLYYIHTLSSIEIMDLNDESFKKYSMNIELISNNNEYFNQFEQRIFNRCYCSYTLESAISYLPKWTETCFSNNNINIFKNIDYSQYNVIFRAGGYYFDENEMNIMYPSDDIEILIFDAKELIFNNDRNDILNTYCLSIPSKLPSFDRYKLLYNNNNKTLLLNQYTASNDNDNDNDNNNNNQERKCVFVYELNLENLEWNELIKSDKIYGSSLCLIENNSKLLMIGGINEFGEKLKTVQIYSYLNKKKESNLPSMNFERNENLYSIYDDIQKQIIVGGGMKDKYHENKLEIFDMNKQIWIPFNYIFNHNHREPLIWFDCNNNKNTQIIYIGGNELENFKRIGFVEMIDLRKNYGKTIIGKWRCVGGGTENTKNKNINISIKQMFNYYNQQKQIENLSIFPRVNLLHSWL